MKEEIQDSIRGKSQMGKRDREILVVGWGNDLTTPEIRYYPGLLYHSSLWSDRWLRGVNHSTQGLSLHLIGMYV